MIIEALVAGRVGFGAVWAVPEKAEGGQRSFYRRCTRHKSTLDSHWVRRQGEGGSGNTRRPICSSLVDHETVVWIRLMQKVAE